MERLTTKRKWEEARRDLHSELGYSHIWKRLNAIEDILGDDYELDRLRELVQADRDGRCVIRPVKLGTPVWSSVFCRVDDDGIEHPTYPWKFDDSMLSEWGTGWHLTEEDALKALED